MKRNSHRIGVFVFSLVTCAMLMLGLTPPANAGVKVAGDDTTYLKIGGLLQVHGAIAKDGAPTGNDPGMEFYLRRMRLMVYGQLNDKVNYFIETDSPRLGLKGNHSMNMFIQDAYMELNLHKAIQIDVGMLLTPFSHHGMQGATSLLGLDYHGGMIKYPSGSTKVWRDYGIMIRGMLSKMFEYRIAIMNGVHGNKDPKTYGTNTIDTDPRNAKDLPRVTTRFTFNFLDPEGGPGVGGMFYDGLYIKKTDDGIVSTKKVLSVGTSFDWQHNLNIQYKPTSVDGTTEAPLARSIDKSDDYFAVAGDLFWDIPLGAKKIMSLNGQINGYYYNHGDRSKGLSYYDMVGNKSNFTGYGVASELGFRYSAYTVLASFDWFDSTDAITSDTGDFMSISGGFNYWMFAQGFNIKAQLGGTKAGGSDEWGVAGTLQAQLLF